MFLLILNHPSIHFSKKKRNLFFLLLRCARNCAPPCATIILILCWVIQLTHSSQSSQKLTLLPPLWCLFYEYHFTFRIFPSPRSSAFWLRSHIYKKYQLLLIWFKQPSSYYLIARMSLPKGFHPWTSWTPLAARNASMVGCKAVPTASVSSQLLWTRLFTKPLVSSLTKACQICTAGRTTSRLFPQTNEPRGVAKPRPPPRPPLLPPRSRRRKPSKKSRMTIWTICLEMMTMKKKTTSILCLRKK